METLHRWLTADRVFVVLATVFGLAFLIATPPLDPADERHHMARVYALSEGNVNAAGPVDGHRHQIPRSLNALHPPYLFVHPDGRIDRVRGRDGQIVCLHDIDEVFATLRIPLEPGDREDISRVSTYGPLTYIPQALTVWVARHLGGSAGVLLYVARLATLAVWIAISWLALRITPVKPWTLLVLSLSPMSLFLGSVVSADAITNALALLLLAAALRAAFADQVRVEGALAAALIALSASLGFVKQGYWLLGATLLLIPTSRFRARRHQIQVIGLAAAAMVALAALWAISLGSAQSSGANIEVGIAATLAPFSDFGAWLARLSGDSKRILAQFVGFLGHLDVVLPRWIYTAYPLVAIAVAVLEPSPAGLGAGRRLTLAAIAFSGVLTVLVLLFAISPDPNTARAGMVQGRYFIPFAPLLLVALPGWGRLPRFWGPAAIVIFCAVVLTAATYTTASHYFIGTAPPR